MILYKNQGCCKKLQFSRLFSYLCLQDPAFNENEKQQYSQIKNANKQIQAVIYIMGLKDKCIILVRYKDAAWSQGQGGSSFNSCFVLTCFRTRVLWWLNETGSRSNYSPFPVHSCLPAENRNSLLVFLLTPKHKFDTEQVKSNKVIHVTCGRREERERTVKEISCSSEKWVWNCWLATTTNFRRQGVHHKKQSWAHTPWITRLVEYRNHDCNC